MISRRRARNGCLAASLGTLSLLQAALPAAAVTTNAVRGNEYGTVPIITVTAPSDQFKCPAAGCSPAALTVTLNSKQDLLNTTLRDAHGIPGEDLSGRQVYVWWLKGAMPADVDKTDCTRKAALPNSRTPVDTSTITFDGNGQAVLLVNLPSSDFWTYGTNWLCATTAQPGSLGGIGDLMVTVTV